MRYFTSYLKKVILLRNSRYLCDTPNTVHKWLDDVMDEQVVLKMSSLIWEIYQSSRENYI